MSMEMNKALDLLHGLVSEVERKTCCHEETHRGGAIWEICDSCGAKWADDEGGKPEFAWPESVEKAREFLATHPAVEQAGGDERAAFRPAQVISYRPGMGEVTIYVAGRVPGYMNIGDTVYVSDRAPVEQPSAALAQPSPTLPPFAEKVLAKLRRFYDCAEDFESGGVDIGRHWLDLLTQLGLLNRVQRSPALWEISQQGEDLLGTPHPSPAQAEKAEAERPELWAVHAQGPDELYAAFTREDAEKHAAELNALPMPEGIAVGAVVVPSPWPEAEHWKYLAEQERDHKNEIAVRLRQFERICEGLPQDAIDGGWTVQGIRCYAKRLEDQLKSALARVAELEKQEPVATVARVPGEDWNGLHFYRDLQGMQPGTKLYAAPVAQAQHSVPAYVSYTTRPAESLAGIALRQLKDESRWVEIRDINAHAFPDMQSHSYYPAGTVIKLPAAAPGKEGL